MAYTTRAELRSEGVIEADYSNAVVDEAIAFAGEYIDRVCDQFFESRTQTREYDGSGSQLLVLDVPLLAMTALEWQDFSTTWSPQTLTDFAVYNRIPADQHYPRIRIKETGNYSIQTRSLGTFPVGTLNIRITGSWGFVESDGVGGYRVPRLINKVCKILAVAWMDTIGDGALLEVLRRYGLTEEQTKTHRYKLSEAMAAGTLTGIGIVDSVLLMFKRRGGAGNV